MEKSEFYKNAFKILETFDERSDLLTKISSTIKNTLKCVIKIFSTNFGSI